MHTREIAKSVVPHIMRQSLREWQQRRRFRRVMSRYVAGAEDMPPDGMSEELIAAWGNPGWSAGTEFLGAAVAAARKAQGPILECGSGLSTLLMGTVTTGIGNTIWALEHNPEWGQRVQREIDRWHLNSVHLCVAPLKDYGEYSWYDPPRDGLPERFSLVICDGPPADTPGGRYGLLPTIRERLDRSTVILLDDAVREDERQIGERWATELGSECRVLGAVRPYLCIGPQD